MNIGISNSFMKIYKNIFQKIISPENLFSAWDEFHKDKKNKKDVQKFGFNLEQNIFKLHRDLKNKKYRHGSYFDFYIRDPKLRHIHKASVQDRILHHAVFRILNPVFEPTFIPTSFSCRICKGNHKGVSDLNAALRKVSRNGFKICFVLKCDVKRFFENIDRGILLKIIVRKVKDVDAIRLIEKVVESFPAGLPIGNLTSQLFANVYLNEFDQFVKNELKIKYYFRYTDDFVIVSEDMLYLKNLIHEIRSFLSSDLKLELHPKKITIRKFNQGIDFLGYIVLTHYRLVRTKTKRRIFKKLRKRINEYKKGVINRQTLEQSFQSYLGVFSHANTYKLNQELKNQFWFWLNE